MAAARPLAAVAGASTGIGFELAQCCADHGYDLLLAADNMEIESAALKLRESGARVDALRADLATKGGVEQLIAAAGGRGSLEQAAGCRGGRHALGRARRATSDDGGARFGA